MHHLLSLPVDPMQENDFFGLNLCDRHMPTVPSVCCPSVALLTLPCGHGQMTIKISRHAEKSLFCKISGTPFIVSLVRDQESIFYQASRCHQFIPITSRLLSSERAALCESGLATGGLAKDSRAAGTDDDGLCV